MTLQQMEYIVALDKYRHFVLGILAIFLYMSVEVGTPTYVLQYLTADTEAVIAEKASVMDKYEKGELNATEAATAFYQTTAKPDEDPAEVAKSIKDIETKINDKQITAASVKGTVPGKGMDATIVGLIVAVYWLMMLVGRFVGSAIGGKISSRAMITTAATLSILLLAFGMFAVELNRVFTTSFKYRAWNNCLPFSRIIYTQKPTSRRHPPFHSHCSSRASMRKSSADPCASSPQRSIPKSRHYSSATTPPTAVCSVCSFPHSTEHC